MNNFWKKLYSLPKSQPIKRKHVSKKQCEQIAEQRGYKIEWDYFGTRKHKVTPDELGEGICYNTNEVMDRLYENE